MKPLTITELDCQDTSAEPTRENAMEVYKNSYSGSTKEDNVVDHRPLKRLPNNYVQMRDVR